MLQMITSGVALGAIYGLIALGIVMVYKATGILNFAHGEAAMICAFVAFSLVKLGLPLWAVVLLTLAFGGLLGFSIERFVLRRFIGKPLLASAIATLGLFLLFGDMAIWIWGKDTQELPSVFPSRPIDLGGGVVVSAIDIGILGICALLALLLFVFFRFTRTGIAMQATMENPTAARLMGIPIKTIHSMSWSLSHMIAALAGLLIAPLTFLHASMMQHALHFAFAAAVLGGIGSMPGALLGGVIIGVTGNLTGAYLSSSWKDVMPFIVMLMILILRPHGLLARSQTKKV
jgi:branched-chain amino acid transport system permease protein